MIYIKKGTSPKGMDEKVIEITKSDEWKNADAENTSLLRSFFDQLDKQPIRDALVREQHGLCAYCMKRIEPNEKMNIEHYNPVKGYKEKVLNYGNMLGCCSGGSKEDAEHKVLCCDAAKKSTPITIDPRDRTMMDRIRYRRDGWIHIYPEDEKLQNDIDNVLKLNGELNKDGSLKRDTSTHIVMGRRQAYRKFVVLMEALSKKYKGNEPRIQSCVKKMIFEIEEKEQYPEFAGVTLYFLKRRLYGVCEGE